MTYYSDAKAEELPGGQVNVVSLKQFYVWLDRLNGDIARMEMLRKQLITDINAIQASKEAYDEKAYAEKTIIKHEEEPTKPADETRRRNRG